MVNYYLTNGAGVYNGAKIASLINGVVETGLVHTTKMKLENQFIPYTIIVSYRSQHFLLSFLYIPCCRARIGENIAAWDI